MNIEVIISKIKDLSDMFTGDFKSKHEVVIKWEEYFTNIDNLNSISEDKLNLSNDWKNVAGDIRKSYEDAKEMLTNG